MKRCLPLGIKPHTGLFVLAMAVRVLGVYAAPLEGGYAAAPKASSPQSVKDAASREARFRLLAAAGTYELTPYRYGGIDRNGLDCSGLIYVSFRDALGVSVPRTTTALYSWTEQIPAEKAQPGDLLFFKTTRGGAVSHVGIYAGGRRFIHAASEGPLTGVIYSGLDETYWASTYAGAGRALPESDINNPAAAKDRAGDAPPTRKSGGEAANRGKKTAVQKQAATGNLLLGFAAAPTWNSFLANGEIIRGVAGQFRLGAAASPFNRPMIFGMELRPEWDGALGVFRLPFTLSWGLSDKFRIFAGPVLSFGDAAMAVSGENRRYTGGTAWFGAAGVTIAPFLIPAGSGELAPYGELAWQSYRSDNKSQNFNADFAASFRLSTGFRYTWKAR